ncbi:MAG: hypothetical protein WCJ71_04090 [Candidatus Omnitrophota bacterium]
MKRGFALITVLAVAIVVALATTKLLQSLGSNAAIKSNNLQDSRAQFLAEAGMQHALWQCSTPTGCLCNPEFQVSVNINGAPVIVEVPITVSDADKIEVATPGYVRTKQIKVEVDYSNV